MGEYTPTTADIREWWAEDQDRTHGAGIDAHMDEFDRWLAEHDREVRAAALREAADDWWARDDVTDRFGPYQWLRDRADALERTDSRS